MSEHEGHRDRLRARFLKDGNMTGFAPHEALELLLTYAIPRKDVNPIAHSLLDHFGSFHAVLEARQEDLTAVRDIGPGAAMLIRLLLPVFRMYENDRLAERKTIASYREARDYCASLFKGVTDERFYLISLDARLRILSAQVLSEGTVDEVAVYPRQVLSLLLRQNAQGALLAHNHPGQSAAPSREDTEMTLLLRDVMDKVGIRLFDHVICGTDGTHSFAQHGQLDAGEGATCGKKC